MAVARYVGGVGASASVHLCVWEQMHQSVYKRYEPGQSNVVHRYCSGPATDPNPDPKYSKTKHLIGSGSTIIML